MAVTWLRGGTELDGLNLIFIHFLVADFGGGQALRRTITHTQLTLHNPDSADVDNLIAYGAMFAVEVTPADVEPDPLTKGSLEGRDLLHFDVAPGRLIAGQNDAIKYIAIPADTGYLTIDTPVQRRADDVPGLRVWAEWALIPSLSGDVNVRMSMDWHILIDDLFA